MVVMIICHTWLVVEDVALFKIMFQIHSWYAVVHGGTLMNQLSQGAIMVSLLSHWVSGEHL